MDLEKISVPYENLNQIKELDDDVLLDDHRWMHVYWANLKRGNKMENWDKEIVKKTHAAIVQEMLLRFFFPAMALELDQTEETIKVVTEWLELGAMKVISAAEGMDLIRTESFIENVHKHTKIPQGILIALWNVVEMELNNRGMPGGNEPSWNQEKQQSGSGRGSAGKQRGSYNSPTFAYIAVYGKEPDIPLSGRINSPEKEWKDGILVDEHLKLEWLDSIDAIEELELRASCEGHGENRVTHVVVRLKSRNETESKKLVEVLNNKDDIYSKYDVGTEGYPRIVIAGKTWYGQPGWNDWWETLSEKIKTALKAIKKELEENLSVGKSLLVCSNSEWYSKYSLPIAESDIEETDWIEFEKTKPPFMSPGGKMRQSKQLVTYIPEHKIYCEPFAGAANVLFRKEPCENEILSDLDSDLIVTWKFIKSCSEIDLGKLSRFYWERPKDKKHFKSISDQECDSMLDTVYKFMYVRYWGFRGGKTFSESIAQDRTALQGSAWERIKGKIVRAKDRVKNVKFERANYEDAIAKHDSKITFFYLDPPYGKTGAHYWKTLDYEKLLNVVKKIRGNFLLQLHNDDKIKNLFGKHFKIYTITARYIRNQSSPDMGQLYNETELLISNYELKTSASKSFAMDDDLAPVASSGIELGKEIQFDDILSDFNDDYVIDPAFISLGGNILSGETDEMVDYHVSGNFGQDFKVPLEFRLGRGSSFTERQSINYHAEKTDVELEPLYALVARRINKKNTIIQMNFTDRVSTPQNPPDLITPETGVVFEKSGETNLILKETVINEAKAFILVTPFVYVVGGVVTQGATKGDVDILIRGQFDEPFLSKITQPLIDRSSTPKRLHFLDDKYHGPFTAHVPIYELMLVPVSLLENSDTKKQRVASPELIREAARSKSEDRIEMFRFFTAMKPTKGFFPEQRQTIDAFLSLFKEDNFPVMATKKYDGMASLCWKSGKRVEIWSIEGENNTDRFPNVVKEIQELNADELALLIEIEMWDDGKHLPREATVGYVHSDSPADDSQITANVFDIVYVKGLETDVKDLPEGDIHKEPFSIRDDVLKALSFEQETDGVPDPKIKLNRTPSHKAENAEELKKLTNKLSATPGSEGVVAKPAKGTYVLHGRRGEQIKFHVSAVANVIVIKRIPISGAKNVYTYLFGFKVQGQDISDKKRVRMRGKEYLSSGKTFNTSLLAKVGEVIEIEFEQLNYIINLDSGEEDVTLWAPRVMRKINVAGDSIAGVIKKAKDENILVTKEIENKTIVYKTWDNYNENFLKSLFNEYNVEWIKDVSINNDSFSKSDFYNDFSKKADSLSGLISIDLCSGAGGLSLGLEKAGFSTAIMSDLDDDSMITAEKNFKNTVIWKADLFKLDFQKLHKSLRGKQLNLLAAGLPCQGHSVRGKGKHSESVDEIENTHESFNKLYKYFLKGVMILQPEFILIENVPGILSNENGKYANLIIYGLKKLNYDVEYKILKAEEYGVPQIRRRVFFIGNRLGLPIIYPRSTEKRISTWDAIKDLSNKSEDVDFGHIIPKHSTETKNRISQVKPGKKYVTESGKEGYALRRIPKDKPAYTILASTTLIHPTLDRFLTPRECARIQSFPDSFKFHGGSQSQFRQIGNAVPPELAKAIGLVMKKQLVNYKNSKEKIYKNFEKQKDPYMIIPDENEIYNFVAQHHARGKSIHTDLRMESEDKDFLIGYTLDDQIKSAIKEPILTLAQLKKVDADDSNFKINWSDGTWDKRKRGEVLVNVNINTQKKAIEPVEWLGYEGVVESGGEEKPAPGATRFFPGVFHVVDKGTVEYGSQRSYFHEYFLSGKKLNYRIIVRLLNLPAGTEGDIPKSCLVADDFIIGKEENLITTETGLVYKDSLKAEEILPPSEPQEVSVPGPIRLTMKPIDQRPYVLSKRAVDKGWMPPDKKSALPKQIRKKIPDEFQYWKVTGTKARDIRDSLVKAIKDGVVKIEFEEIRKQEEDKEIKGDYTFSYQWFKGPVVVREGPSKEQWHIFLDFGKKKVAHILLQSNPLTEKSVSATVKPDIDKEVMSLEGFQKPGTLLNPTKETPSWVKIKDKGKIIKMVDKPTFKKYEFKGTGLKGLYTLTAESPDSNIWILESSELPEVK